MSKPLMVLSASVFFGVYLLLLLDRRLRSSINVARARVQTGDACRDKPNREFDEE
jgi:hypothetical protein